MFRDMRKVTRRPSFWLILVGCGLVNVLAWWLGPVDDLSFRIAVSVLAALMLILDIRFARRWRIPLGPLIWLITFFSGAVVLIAGERLGVVALETNSAILLALLPFLWIVWRLMGSNWFLATGLVVAAVAMMVYWTAALLLEENDPLELLLLPLTAVMLIAVLWSRLARMLLRMAQSHRSRWLAGPGLRSLVMAWLFLPTIVVAVVVPPMLGLGGIWSAVSLTLTGFLLSTVVSGPLRCFLLRWGNLAP